MSYDLDLFRTPPGADPLTYARQAYERGEDPSVPPAYGWRERMHALSAALAAADPTLAAESYGTGEEEHVELNGPEDGSGLQILLFAGVAYLHLPYWHAGAEARRAWEPAWRALAVLEREGGYRTYDPQLDRVLDLESDREAVLTAYGDGVAAAREISDAAIPPDAGERPWWKFWG